MKNKILYDLREQVKNVRELIMLNFTIALMGMFVLQWLDDYTAVEFQKKYDSMFLTIKE